MTAQPTESGFFQGAAGGEGAPTAQLAEVDHWVQGTIVSQRVQRAKDLNTGEDKVDRKTGAPIFQLAVILQTDFRNWQGVTKVPLVDRQDASKGYKPASEDDGKRALYIEQNKNLQFATARAVVAAGRPEQEGVLNGGTLLVRVSGLRETGKPFPMKEHEVTYTPPSSSNGFLQGEAAAPVPPPAPQAPPAPAAPPAPPAPPAPAGYHQEAYQHAAAQPPVPQPPAPPAAPPAPPTAPPVPQQPPAPQAPPAPPAPAAPPAPQGDPWAGAQNGGATQPTTPPF